MVALGRGGVSYERGTYVDRQGLFGEIHRGAALAAIRQGGNAAIRQGANAAI